MTRIYIEVDLYEGGLYDQQVVKGQTLEEILNEVIDIDDPVDKQTEIDYIMSRGKGSVDKEWKFRGEETISIIFNIEE